MLALLERCAAHGPAPLLVVGPPGPHEVALVTAPGHAVTRLEIASLVRDPAPLRDLRALLALARTLRRVRPAIIHTHTAKAGALGRLAARLAARGARTVHTFHGHSLDARVHGRGAHAWLSFERALARGATDLVLAVSPAQRDELARLLPAAAARLRVLPLAFDPHAYPPAPAGLGERLRALAPGPDGRVLLFVGRGVRVKGLDLLAGAAARVAGLDPAAAARLAVVVVGPVDPAVRAGVEALRAGVPAPAWTFWGPEPNPLPLIASADALVLPSRAEGTPVAALEALALGKPVLGAAVGGVPELLAADWERAGPGVWSTRAAPPRGLLLPPGDVEAWAAALARFAREPAAVPGDGAGRRRFVQDVFDPDRAAADLCALYAAIRA